MTKRTLTLATRKRAGVRGGAIAAAALALTLGLSACGSDEQDNTEATSSETASETASEEASETASETPSEEPSEESSAASEPSSSAPADDAAQAAAGAPKDAAVPDFCRSFDLEALSQLGSAADLSKLQSLQADMIEVGTPADMNAKARAGWEWFAGINGPEDISSMNNDDLQALGMYYGTNCSS